MKSYKVQTNTVTRRGQQLRETRTQDQMCTTAFALLQHSEADCGDLTACKSNPFFFFNSMTLITATAGQDTGSGNYEEATNDGLSKSRGKRPEMLKLRILSLLHISIPGQLKVGTEALFLTPTLIHSYFFTKTHTYIHPAVHSRPSPIKQRMDLVCKSSPMPWDQRFVTGNFYHTQRFVLSWLPLSASFTWPKPLLTSLHHLFCFRLISNLLVEGNQVTGATQLKPSLP